MSPAHADTCRVLQENDRVVLAQRYAEGGDLLRALHKAGGRLTERSAVQMVVQPLLNCLVYLHSKGITHRCALPVCLLLLQTLLVSGQYAHMHNMTVHALAGL